MKKIKLKNGLTVLLTPQKETKAVTILVLVGVGSRYEKDTQAGIAHFLEHMMFKGTMRRPSTLILSKELDKVGAEYNAYTSNDHTGYWIKINAEHLELAIDMLSDMLFHSKFEEKEIEREKGTIIEEINMYEDDPRRYSGVLLGEILYRGNTLARDVIGSKETVKAVTRNGMVNFLKANYFPKNMVVSIAGKINIKDTKDLIEDYFSRAIKNKAKPFYEKFNQIQKRPQVLLKYKDTEQVHLSIGFLGPSYKDEELVATQILSVILGGSMSSRLFINVRERKGLCYYIRCVTDTFQDIGGLVVQAGLDKKRIKAAIELILKELKKVKDKGITPDELKKGKEFLKGKLILDLEDSSSVAEWYGRQQLLIGRAKTPEKKLEEINEVTQKQVNKLAKRIFKKSMINLALIGPFKSDKEFKKLLKI